MAEEMMEIDSTHFQKLSADFLKWFESTPGTRMSPKITLADLRSRDAGRGVGMLTGHFLVRSSRLTICPSCKYRHLCRRGALRHPTKSGLTENQLESLLQNSRVLHRPWALGLSDPGDCLRVSAL